MFILLHSTNKISRLTNDESRVMLDQVPIYVIIIMNEDYNLDSNLSGSSLSNGSNSDFDNHDNAYLEILHKRGVIFLLGC